MKKLISFALLGAFLAVASVGCGDDKAKKNEPAKKEPGPTDKNTKGDATPK